MKLGKKALLVATAILSLGLLAGCGSEKQADAKKVYKVGIIQQLEHKALDEANKGFVAGLAAKGYEQGKNLEIDQQNAQGDQANLRTIAQRFLTEKDDLVGAIATNAAQTMANATKKVPIVGMAITDYEAAKLVKTNAHPGGNVTGVSDAVPAEKYIELIRGILPNAKTVGVIYNAGEINSEVQVKSFTAAAEAAGMTVKAVTVNSVNDIRQAAESLVNQGVQAVYVPTDNVVASAYPNLIQVTTAARIPVFPSESSALQAGALAMYSINYYDLGYQAGLMAGDILAGKSQPADMPIESPKNLKLYINEDAAKALGITIPEAMQAQAKDAK